MQQNIKLRTIYNINHINRNDTVILGRNPRTKPKIRKLVQQYERTFLLRKYESFTVSEISIYALDGKIKLPTNLLRKTWKMGTVPNTAVQLLLYSPTLYGRLLYCMY